MTQRKILFNLVVLALFLLLTDLAFAEDTLERLKRLQQDGDSSIVFYGLVKDQNGQPVPGAKISAGYECFSLTAMYFMDRKSITVETDSNGRFLINSFSGKKLFIDDMAKDGYFYYPSGNPKTTYEYDKFAFENKKHKPDINNPVVFVLKKNPQPGLVIQYSKSVIIDARGRVYYIDFIKGFMLLEKRMKKLDSDIVLTINTPDNGTVFTIDLKVTDNNSGLVSSDAEPHIAPDDGYQRTINYNISKGEEIKMNIYFKGNKGAYGEIFARLEIESRLGSSGLRFRSNLYTNLEGTKNLEYDFNFTKNELARITGKVVRAGTTEEFSEAAPIALMKLKEAQKTK